MTRQIIIIIGILFTLSNLQIVLAITPYLGGGQTTASMAHIGVGLVGNQITAHLAEGDYMPTLRKLPYGLSFAPTDPWEPLANSAYNGQYGWNTTGFFTIPAGASFWIKRINSSPGLRCYHEDDYSEILTTDNPSDPNSQWRWDAIMTHNFYGVRNVTQTTYVVTYEIFFGDTITGNPANYNHIAPAQITLSWHALPGDFNGDDQVDLLDLILLSNQWLIYDAAISVTSNENPIALFEFSMLAWQW